MMSADPSRIKRLKTLAGSNPTAASLEAIETELYLSTNDRATVVLFTSFLEGSLSKLIETKFRKNLNSDDKRRVLGPDGVAGSFGQKIILAYVFGFIGPKTKADLDDIRNLRNAFAHSRIFLSFDTPEVIEVCKHLRIGVEPNSHIPFFYLNKVETASLGVAVDKDHPKTRFITTCHNLAERMFAARDYPQPGDKAYSNNEPLP